MFDFFCLSCFLFVSKKLKRDQQRSKISDYIDAGEDYRLWEHIPDDMNDYNSEDEISSTQKRNTLRQLLQL